MTITRAGHGLSETAATAVAVSIVIVLGWVLVMRPGYSPDEEITIFAVRGIAATGVPAMPSGWIYWRGAAYSYLVTGFDVLIGDALLTARLISLIAAIVSVAGISIVGRRIVGDGAAAALLLAIWPLTASLSGYARFYAPFVALYIAALLAVSQVHQRRSSLWWFVLAAVVARGLQEFALSLLIVPIAAALSAAPGERRRYGVCALVSAAAVGIAHLLLTLPQNPAGAAVSHWGFNRFALPATTIGSLPALTLAGPADFVLLFAVFASIGVALHRRWGGDLLFIIAAAVVASVFALGTIVAVVVTAILLRPARAGRTAAIALLLLVLSAIAWLMVITWRTDIAMSAAFAADLVVAAFRFPFSAARQLSIAMPVVALTVVGGIAIALWRARGAGEEGVILRAFACTLWLHVIAVGVFDIDLRVRHLAMLMPLAAIFAGVAMTVTLKAALRSQRATAIALALGVIAAQAAAMVVEQRRFASAQIERPARGWWGTWSPPVAQSTFSTRAAPAVAGDDVVISNDELAAILRLGRIDYWLAPAPAAELLTFDGVDGVRRGMYVASALIDGEDLAEVVAAARESRPVSFVVFHTGKFGIDSNTSQKIAELHGGQVIETDDWTHIRWLAIAR